VCHALVKFVDCKSSEVFSPPSEFNLLENFHVQGTASAVRDKKRKDFYRFGLRGAKKEKF
jgi:hypothetical protein